MKRTILISGSIVLIVLLAGVAWLSIQTLTGPDEAAADAPAGKGVKVMELVRDEGNGPTTLRVTIEPADELPTRHPETAGIFVERAGDIVSIGTGNIEIDVNVEVIDGQESKPDINYSYSGPVVEVVVNEDTVIYNDVTDLNLKPDKDMQGEITVQQLVQRVDMLGEIDEDTELQVWGKKQGDQIVAEVLVYRPNGHLVTTEGQIVD